MGLGLTLRTGFSSLMSVSSSVLPGFSVRIAALLKLKPRAALALAVACAFLHACSPAANAPLRQANNTSSDQPAIGAISALPPNAAGRPLQPGQSGTLYTPDGLPALLPPSKGLNADQLFAEKISNDNERFKRLENAVADLRREFDAVKPAIIRLTAVESDMEELITQLQSLVPGAGAHLPPPPGANINDQTSIPDIGPMADGATRELVEEPAVPAQPVAPVTAIPPRNDTAPMNEAQKAEAQEKSLQKPISAIAAATPPPAPVPAATNPAPTAPVIPVTTPMQSVPAGQVAVTGVRIADHDGRTRIVVDASAKAAYTHNIDNTERLLMIEIPSAAWRGPAGGQVKSQLAKGWTASDDGTNVIIAIELKNKAELVSSSVLSAPFRIVFDLKTSP